jgi:NSS family neurotransmitter:Na+ symporter
MSETRAQWKSKFGFILAASGSAIGLGNIVFFPANAYKYGGGAFYLPYFIALFLVGIPVMILEFGLGAWAKKSFPLAMRQAGGKVGEFAGWFAILNAAFITMYYVTILGWVVGMAGEALTNPVNDIFLGKAKLDWGPNALTELGNPAGTFFGMISTWLPMGGVLFVWLLNGLLVSKGTKTIEAAVKIFVPLMWVTMIVLIVRGVTLPGGTDGVSYLFSPDLSVLGRMDVWKGAMSQMFFTLSLGFGVMTAYASYLPKKSDHSHNALTTSLLNCGFEWIAGVAIFSMLFALSIQPKASTLSMMFFIVPQGIAKLPVAAQQFAIGFFFLLLIAGLTSSISLVEALVAAMQDKFRISRTKTLAFFGFLGFLGSAAFALPKVIDPQLGGNGTLGLSLLDLMDHWAFSYGLLIVGLVECLVIGWGIGSHRIREFVNKNSKFHLGPWFDGLIKFVIPLLLIVILVINVIQGEVGNGLYGGAYAASYVPKDGFFMKNLHVIVLLVWLVGTLGMAFLLTHARGVDEVEAVCQEEGEMQ